jgi:hypothetical protein
MSTKEIQEKGKELTSKMLLVLDEADAGVSVDVAAALAVACTVCIAIGLEKEFCVEGFSKAFDFYKTISEKANTP